MPQHPEILLLEGFCSLRFGARADDAIALFGEVEEIQQLNDELLGNSSTVYHYWDQGFSLFFDNNRQGVFCSVETDNKDCELYGLRIFSLKEKEVVALLKENGHGLSDTETHAWGEKRLSFDTAGLDCYFENNRMVSVNFGVLETGSAFTYFPN